MINESGEQIKITKREKNLAVSTHLCSLVGLIIFIITLVIIGIDVVIQYKNKSSYNLHSIALVIIPIIINPLIPFIFWSSSKKISHFVNEHCKQSFNFQISVTLYFILSIASVFVAIGVILLFILVLFDIASVVNAIKKAINGEIYSYPLAIHFV